jgi:hypothetical protein
LRDNLAERLLATVMQWSLDDVVQERPILQALATFKYDEYQQYFPGMRFIESLAMWLSQFPDEYQKRIAYNFVRNRLIFISDTEMNHLVSIAFQDFIRPVLIHRTALELEVPNYSLSRIIRSVTYQSLQRRSLFLGLSDGAHIGTFRRNNPQLSNEQVRQNYEIPEDRANDMQEELKNDLHKILGRDPTDTERRFCTVFLLDDFSASGLSFLRKTEASYKGKIAKVLNSIYAENGDLRNAVDLDAIHVCVVLYCATTQAKTHLNHELSNCIKQYSSNAACSIQVIQEIPLNVCIQDDYDDELIGLLKEHFDKDIVDRHFRVGRHERPYLGYDEGALPLVLAHNTPNNSIPLLWFDKTRKYQGLFPRVSRHRR